VLRTMKPMGQPVDLPSNTPLSSYLVCLLARGRYLALSRSATVQFVLDEVEIDVDACRHTIDDASYCCSVTLAKRGQCE